MKKHDEGYTLPFVLVILAILYFVVSIVLTSAETTVVAQQKSIAQMKEKYAAQGKIEMLVGQLCDETIFNPAELSKDFVTFAVNELCEGIDSAGSIKVIDEPELTLGTGEFEYTFTIQSEQGSVRIVSKMVLTCKYDADEATGVHTITDLDTRYVTYEVGTVGGDAP